MDKAGTTDSRRAKKIEKAMIDEDSGQDLILEVGRVTSHTLYATANYVQRGHPCWNFGSRDSSCCCCDDAPARSRPKWIEERGGLHTRSQKAKFKRHSRESPLLVPVWKSIY